jgi:hypothetical protein
MSQKPSANSRPNMMTLIIQISFEQIKRKGKFGRVSSEKRETENMNLKDVFRKSTKKFNRWV